MVKINKTNASVDFRKGEHFLLLGVKTSETNMEISVEISNIILEIITGVLFPGEYYFFHVQHYLADLTFCLKLRPCSLVSPFYDNISINIGLVQVMFQQLCW